MLARHASSRYYLCTKARLYASPMTAAVSRFTSTSTATGKVHNHDTNRIVALSVAAAAMTLTAVATMKSTHMEAVHNNNNHDSDEIPHTLRTESFPLVSHNHGKAKVRVLKVNRDTPVHSIVEYNVATKVWNDEYAKVFTHNDNTDLVATDTQRNTVYVVAKRTKADSPEQFGLDLCQHFLNQYPMLDAAEVEVDQVLWERVSTTLKSDSGDDATLQLHPHGFMKHSPETAASRVRLERGKDPVITSYIRKMTVLKTTLSGFEGYLQDEYTLLPPTSERCLATELDATWTYTVPTEPCNFGQIRQQVRQGLLQGIFGPPSTGVYSVSLQATIYDAACLVLRDVPEVASIQINTPNLHYLPFVALNRLGGGEESFQDDIFVPTSEPSGSIMCLVAREIKKE